MGNYASASDVASEFKGITFSSSSPVTTNEVDAFIDQFEAVVDAKLNGIYEVPIASSATSSLNILKMITIMCVADRVRAIMQVKNIGDPKVQHGARSPGGCAKAEKMLDEIRDKKIILPDATLVESSGGFDSFAVRNSLEHTFQKSVDQW